MRRLPYSLYPEYNGVAEKRRQSPSVILSGLSRAPCSIAAVLFRLLSERDRR